MITRCCPTCGRPNVSEAVRRLDKAKLRGSLLGKVISRLARCPGEYVPYAAIVDVVYADDPNGGPLNPQNVISARLSGDRDRLMHVGLKVESEHGFGYRLRLCEVPA